MSLTLAETKDLITFGLELGLQQLQTDGLVVVYGHKPSTPAQLIPLKEPEAEDDIVKHYASIGRAALGK
jgi:hypothetical protein